MTFCFTYTLGGEFSPGDIINIEMKDSIVMFSKTIKADVIYTQGF
jgi:hypothetical protein